MQLISYLSTIFPKPLYLRPYQILSTGPDSGIIEMVVDSKVCSPLGPLQPHCFSSFPLPPAPPPSLRSPFL